MENQSHRFVKNADEPKEEEKRYVHTINGRHFWKPRQCDCKHMLDGTLEVKARPSCKKCCGRGYTGILSSTNTYILCSCVIVSDAIKNEEKPTNEVPSKNQPDGHS